MISGQKIYDNQSYTKYTISDVIRTKFYLLILFLLISIITILLHSIFPKNHLESLESLVAFVVHAMDPG